ASSRSLAQPEGKAGRLAVCVLDAHDALLDAQNLPGQVAELKDVTSGALDREVLVDRAQKRALRLENDAGIGRNPDRAAGRNCEQPGSTAAAKPMVYGVVVH